MQKLLSVSSFLVLPLLVVLCLRASAPAQAAQGDAPGQGLEARVATLESELQAEKRRNEETRALLEQTLAYLDKQAQATQALLVALDEAEQQGFAVGENWRSRQTLLAGMRAYWGDAQNGLPKLPPPVPVKPPAPVRAPRK